MEETFSQHVSDGNMRENKETKDGRQQYQRIKVSKHGSWKEMNQSLFLSRLSLNSMPVDKIDLVGVYYPLHALSPLRFYKPPNHVCGRRSFKKVYQSQFNVALKEQQKVKGTMDDVD